MAATPWPLGDSEIPDESDGGHDEPATKELVVSAPPKLVPLRERIRRPDADTWPLLALGLAVPIGLLLRITGLDLLYVVAGTLGLAVAGQLVLDRIELLRRILARDLDPRRRLRIWISVTMAVLAIAGGTAWVVLHAAATVGAVLVWLLSSGVWVLLAVLAGLGLWVRWHRAARDPSSVPPKPPT